MTHVRLCLIACLLAFTAKVHGELVTQMTPALIREAIAGGKSGALKGLAQFYVVMDPKARARHQFESCGSLTTPYSRVMAEAAKATKIYKDFTEADITPDMLAPEMRVFASALHGPTRVSDVAAVVVMPAGTSDRTKAIRPTTSTPSTGNYQNAMGAKDSGTQMTVTFPLSVIAPGNELHIAYADGTDCLLTLNPQGMK